MEDTFKVNIKPIEIFDGNIKKGSLNYYIDESIFIKNLQYDNEKTLGKLIDRLILLTYYLGFDYYYDGDKDLSKYHFIKKDNSEYLLEYKKVKIKRVVAIGSLKTGEKNNICDVPGVRVSHFTIKSDSFNTGLTVVSPHTGDVFKEKVVASSYSFNGFGKSIGFLQVEELGTIETNIVFTSTLNVGKIADAVVQNSIKENPEIGRTTGTVNPLVMECNDGDLNNSQFRILDETHYFKALEKLDYDFVQGSVGAGSGMICHGFKGGIGSSSRVITVDEHNYTIAVLVNSNFGESNGKSLIFKGHKLSDLINDSLDLEEKGSITGLFVTDLPLNERQIKRVLKRMEIGIGRTGSYAGNGSGDVFVGFTTANKVNHYAKNAITDVKRISDDYLNQIFKGVTEATEEAVLNSMLFSHHVKGFLREVKSLTEVIDSFSNLLDMDIIYEE